MGRQKGVEKTGGRKPGTPNKKTQEVSDLLKSQNYNPITEMVKIALDQSVDVTLRARLHIELAQYVYPKLKAVTIDITTEVDAPHQGWQNMPHHIFMRELYERNREFA